MKSLGNCVIYLDLDGVLANFDSHVTKYFDGIEKYDRNKLHQQWQKLIPRDDVYNEFNEKLLKTVLSIDDFWLTIPKMPNANKVFKLVKSVTDTVIILTAPMKDPKCAEQKYQWVKTNFPNIEHFHCDYHKEKYVGKYFPEKKQILIDDNLENIRKWKLAGGIGIHFSTFSELEKQSKYL